MKGEKGLPGPAGPRVSFYFLKYNLVHTVNKEMCRYREKMDSPDHQGLQDKKVTEAMTAWTDYLAGQALKVTAVCPEYPVCPV